MLSVVWQRYFLLSPDFCMVTNLKLLGDRANNQGNISDGSPWEAVILEYRGWK